MFVMLQLPRTKHKRYDNTEAISLFFAIVMIMIKTAIITGAAKNIGKGIAKGLAEDGFRCILLDKDKDALHRTTQELKSINEDCSDYVIDMADVQAINGFLDWLRQDKCHVDVLINNVGYESDDTVRSLKPDTIKMSNDINLNGPFYLSSEVASLMSGGNIVFITSTHSSVTRMHPLYSSAKAATEMFMKEAALELASSNIRVNAVAPGPVEDMPASNPNKYVPMGFSLQPKDVAECVKFLVSDNARYITGQTIVVDGGFSVAHTHFWKSQNKL